MKRVLPASFAVVSILVACGGGRIPAVGPDRESGQSGLMDKTFAGSNKCNPKNHERPFVIEWDATDMSQFEALTSSDIVFVKYQGCDLKIVDTCKNDSVKGQLGSYKSVDWTSGSVEKIDITNEGELYAKLPLGVATLGARVSAGEAFRMEYFVSGTRSATRPAQYKADLDKIPGCKGVTHFVYAYNLGAFALGSNKNVKGEANATFWGAGAGGSSKYASAAEKKGGLLSSCRGESAREILTCQTPVRLTLRELEDAENPDAKAAVAAETPDAMNLAGKLQREGKMSEEAMAHVRSAQEKSMAKDGKGCLSELDAYDRLQKDGSLLSTAQKSPYVYTRGRCLMLAGQCDAGKTFVRYHFSNIGTTATMVDRLAEGEASRTCQGDSLKPRDKMLRAISQLQGIHTEGAKVDLALCNDAYSTIKKLQPTVKSESDQDPVNQAKHVLSSDVPMCFAKAGDCPRAFATYKEEYTAFLKNNNADAVVSDSGMRDNFDSYDTFKDCRGKDQKLSPRDEFFAQMSILKRGPINKTPAPACASAAAKAKSLYATLKPSGDRDELKYANQQVQSLGVQCAARAGDCTTAWKIFSDTSSLVEYQAKLNEKQLRGRFEGEARSCKDK